MRFAVSFFALLIAVAAMFAAPSAAYSRQPTQLTPEQIRALPITERPNRPGHIYGNTVRFFHHLGTRR